MLCLAQARGAFFSVDAAADRPACLSLSNYLRGPSWSHVLFRYGHGARRRVGDALSAIMAFASTAAICQQDLQAQVSRPRREETDDV
jgi:hypothetical protein